MRFIIAKTRHLFPESMAIFPRRINFSIRHLCLQGFDQHYFMNSPRRRLSLSFFVVVIIIDIPLSSFWTSILLYNLSCAASFLACNYSTDTRALHSFGYWQLSGNSGLYCCRRFDGTFYTIIQEEITDRQNNNLIGAIFHARYFMSSAYM